MQGTVGTARRLARIVSPQSGRGFCVAFDHGLHLGVCPGIEQPDATLDLMIQARVDAVILSPGSVLRYGHRLVGRDAPAIILRLDHTTMWREGTPLAYPDGHTRAIATVEDAIALGADAVITYLFVGHADPELETRSFELCATVNAAARRAGIVHVIETMAARGGLAADVFNPDVVAKHTRIGMELGADLLKTDWPGSPEAMRAIADSLPVPILVAGGAIRGGDDDIIGYVGDVIRGGAAGILFGRNIIQAKDPLGVMTAARAVIHDSTTGE